SKTPFQDLERLFGVGNVVHLPALEGYDLGLRLPLCSLNLNGEFFIVKKPLLDHPYTMVFHFEKERKMFLARFLDSNQKTMPGVSQTFLLQQEIQFWLSLVLGTGWEKKYKKDPIRALIYIAVEADRERMSWDQEIYDKAIVYLIRATDGGFSWMTEDKRGEIWGQLAILEESHIIKIAEYLSENKVFLECNIDRFLDRLETLASDMRVVRTWRGEGAQSLQIRLAAIYAVLIQNERDTIGHSKVQILDDIRDLFRTSVTKVEEACVKALTLSLYSNDPGTTMETELILYDLLSRYRQNETKKELVQKVDKELIDHFKIRWSFARDYRTPHAISFLVERMIDPRFPPSIRDMIRIVLERIAEDAAPSLIRHFERGDPVSQSVIRTFFMNTRERVKPVLERLRQSSDADMNVLIDRILRFIDINHDS
ncbi:MAG: hypothetical protein AAB309_00145, partial [Deltaproteobacteria bacterium]